jgi:hypothetical protein
MKKYSVVVLLAIFILVPAVYAMDLGQRDVISFGKATQISDNVYEVPLILQNDEDLVAMDIPLQYSAGVTLTDVSFTGTRVDYFDAKKANIDEANQRVVLGLINMVFENKPALSKVVSNDNVIATLTFRVDDLSLTEFTIEPFTSKAPSHDLTLIYNDYSSGTPIVTTINPEFENGTVSLRVSPTIPDAFTVSQNYPNPFNPSTEISYALPEAGNVNLEIYNILGQQVKTLVNEFQDAGNYVVTWNGDDETGATVASGVYFYRVVAGEYKEVKKMVMMK